MCAWKGTRPPAVTERDERVFKYLETHGPSSRNVIAEALGQSRSLTYLSLDRLRRGIPDGKPRAKRCVSPDSNELLWTAEVDTPCP